MPLRRAVVDSVAAVLFSVLVDAPPKVILRRIMLSRRSSASAAFVGYDGSVMIARPSVHLQCLCSTVVPACPPIKV